MCHRKYLKALSNECSHLSNQAKSYASNPVLMDKTQNLDVDTVDWRVLRNVWENKEEERGIISECTQLMIISIDKIAINCCVEFLTQIEIVGLGRLGCWPEET